MQLKLVLFNIYFCLVWSRKDVIDGKYHHGIKDFHLLLPYRTSRNGEFQSFHLKQLYEHNVQTSRLQKRSIKDPEIVHYVLRVADKLRQLNLWPNREFLNPNLIFEKRDDSPINKRQIETLDSQELCYYTGNVDGVDASTASISTCDGLLGHIRIENKDYFIEPVKGHSPNENGHHIHVLYDLSKELYRKKRKTGQKSWCAVRDNNWDTQITQRIRDSMYGKISKRSHKAEPNVTELTPKYMETTIVCDKSFIEFHKGHRDLDVYTLTVANTAFNAFRDASFGSELTLSLVRVIYLEKEQPGMDLNVSVSIEDTLASFNSFAERINMPEGDPLHHDVAMLASRVDMCQGKDLKDCVVCGIAKIGGICKANVSANVAEDDGVYELAMTMTHEAGHLLGITHDGAEGLGKPCKNPPNNKGRPKVWIMSVADPIAEYGGWSQCSRAMSAAFIRNGWADCMNDQPEKSNKKFPHVSIGAMYNRDEQCFLSTIRKGKQFEANKTCGDPSECQNLYCQYFEKGKESCQTMNHMVADGTSCGENKWCWNSKCVPKGQRPDSVDGGWSDWSGWTECSRSCGGGIQINRRSCNNPQQANGGRYCEGEDQMIKLCNLEPCDETFRSKVCRKEFKGLPLFLQRNPCQVPCLNPKDKLVWSNVTAPDGEACVWGKKPKKRCISGECTKIGCNDEINSDAILDDCGICNGYSSTCTVIEGRWIQKRNNGPLVQEVTTFPKQAFNIKIKEATGYKSLISISNPDRKIVYINDFEGKHNKTAVEGPKRFAEGVEGYLHINGLSENLTIEGPIKEAIVFKVVYLSEQADFKWKYSMVFGNETPSTEERNYRWEQSDWTECSKVCGGGIQTAVFNCVEEKLGKVGDSFCVGNDAPEPEMKPCKEQPCKTKWKVGRWGECHSCKKKGGIKARGVQCMQENPEKGGDDVLVENEKCKEPKPAETMLCSPGKASGNSGRKRCTLGLPEKYMDRVWEQIENQ